MARFLTDRWLLVYTCLVAFAVRVSQMFIVYHGDMFNHIEWGIFAVHKGLYGIYEIPFNLFTASHINQPPGTVYIFMVVRVLYEWIDALLWFLNNTVPVFPSAFIWFYEVQFYPAMLKMPAIFADIGIGIVLYHFAKLVVSPQKALIASALFLFNPITIYNSAWWGQSDATVNFFGLLAMYFLTRKKLLWAMSAIAASLFIKASLLIFLPFMLVVILKQRQQIKTIVSSIVIPITTVFIITLPFHALTDPFWFVRVYYNRVVFGTLSSATENAFNLWALVFGIVPKQSAYNYVFGLQAAHWGYILIGLMVVALLYQLYRRCTIEELIVSLATVGFAAYLFLTGMHERYLFPIFPYLALLTAFSLRYLPIYIITALIHQVNLYYLWWAPRIDSIVAFLDNPEVIRYFIYTLFIMFFAFVVVSQAWLAKIKHHEIAQ